MRAIFILLVISAFTGFQKLSGQQIIAGQQSGPDIIYTDPIDIQLTCNNLDTYTSFSLDIDQDGINDMTFNASYYYFSHLELQGTQTSIIPNSMTQISMLDSLEYGMLKHEFGDTINEKLNWNLDGMAIFNSYSSNGTTEYFTNEGFVGFRICNTDTIYGWIHASATGNYQSAQLIIYDYAYVSKSNHIDKKEDKSAISCSNPVHDELIIRIQDGNNNMEWKCSVYDIAARNVLNKELGTGENHINMTTFDNGTYFVIIHESTGSRKIFKIIKY